MYAAYIEDKRILFFENEEVVHLKKIDTIYNEFRVQSHDVKHVNYDKMVEDFFPNLLTKEQEFLQLKLKVYNQQVYLFKRKRNLNKTISNGFIHKLSFNIIYEIYEYKRISFINEMKILQDKVFLIDKDIKYLEFKKRSFFEGRKYKQLQKERGIIVEENEAFFNNHLKEYEDWLHKQFVLLKLPLELLIKFKNSFLIASKYDLNYSFIILDTLVEKIIQFIDMAKEIKEKNGYEQAIIKSIPEFIKYIEKQIDKLNQQSYDSLIDENNEINETTNTQISNIQKAIFSESTE